MSNNNNASHNPSWWEGNFDDINDANRRVVQNLQYGEVIFTLENSKFDGKDKAVGEVGEVVAEVVEEEGVAVVAGNEVESSGVDESDEESDEESDDDPHDRVQNIYMHPTDASFIRVQYLQFSQQFGEYVGDPEFNSRITYDDDVGTMSYYGMNTHQCHYCRHFLALHEAMSILEERKNHDNWMVPLCDRCFYPANRPWFHCLELACICDYIESGSV